jgi:hypothetical protein
VDTESSSHPDGLSGALPTSTGRGPWTFGLRTLGLVVTVAAVLMGLFALDLGLGLLYSALLVPPLATTAVVAARHKRRARLFTASDKAGTFAISALWTMLALVLLPAVAWMLYVVILVLSIGGFSSH